MVRNPKRTYLEMVEQRGMFPSPQYRQCTSDLKRGPIDKFIRSLPHKVIVNCTGIRAEESVNRSKQTPWKFNATLSVAGRTVWNWMPIFEETLDQVLSWHWETGTPLHPIYSPQFHRDGPTGGDLNRFSYPLSIFPLAKDLDAIQIHHPQTFD